MISRYNELMLENNLRRLARGIVENGRDARSVMLEAAMSLDDNRLVSHLYNELLGWNRQPFNSPVPSSNIGKTSFADKYGKPKEPEPEAAPEVTPKTADDLKGELKSVIVNLMKAGFKEKDINDFVAATIKAITPPLSVKDSTPDDFADPAGADGAEVADAPGKKKRVPTDPAKPAWYGHMTNSERAWYDALPPDQKKRFIGMHDKDVGGTAMGNLNVPPEEHHEVDKIANDIASRNKGINPTDAWIRAAGIWNRHKIRQKMAGPIRAGREGTPLSGDFEDLLHKDHRKRAGQILDEWCLLAGIEPEKKRKGR